MMLTPEQRAESYRRRGAAISAALMGHPVSPESARKSADAQRGKPKKKCAPDCTCGKHSVSKATRDKLSAMRRGKQRDGSPARGMDHKGYRVLTGLQGHPLAGGESRPGVERGEVRRGRKVLWDSLGCESTSCVHLCHWCGQPVAWDSGLQADHLDGNRANDVPDNLVPSCGPCNSRRAAAGNPEDWAPGADEKV